MLYTLATALSRGARMSVVAAFGCTLGIVPHMAAAITGLAALLHTSAVAFEAVRYLGVAYLLYMAWNTLRERGALRVAAAPLVGDDEHGGDPAADQRLRGRQVLVGAREGDDRVGTARQRVVAAAQEERNPDRERQKKADATDDHEPAHRRTQCQGHRSTRSDRSGTWRARRFR